MTAASAFAWANLTLGALVALAAASPWAGQVLAVFALVQPGQPADTLDQPLARWILAIAGGVWAGWGAGMVRSLSGADAVDSMRVGLVVWSALDSLGSLANGAAANVLVNLAWLGLGLWATRRAA